jgi:lambda repressor-like predicted transcriptional regulator
LTLDWFRILTDLKDRGWSLDAIAVATGIPKATLDAYRNRGVQPPHDRGERILLLWCGATGKLRGEAPSAGQTSKI